MDPNDWFANHVFSIVLLCLLVLVVYARVRSLGGTAGFFLGVFPALFVPALFIAAFREPRSELFLPLLVAACTCAGYLAWKFRRKPL